MRRPLANDLRGIRGRIARDLPGKDRIVGRHRGAVLPRHALADGEAQRQARQFGHRHGRRDDLLRRDVEVRFARLGRDEVQGCPRARFLQPRQPLQDHRLVVVVQALDRTVVDGVEHVRPGEHRAAVQVERRGLLALADDQSATLHRHRFEGEHVDQRSRPGRRAGAGAIDHAPGVVGRDGRRHFRAGRAARRRNEGQRAPNAITPSTTGSPAAVDHRLIASPPPSRTSGPGTGRRMKGRPPDAPRRHAPDGRRLAGACGKGHFTAPGGRVKRRLRDVGPLRAPTATRAASAALTTVATLKPLT